MVCVGDGAGNDCEAETGLWYIDNNQLKVKALLNSRELLLK